MKRTLLIIFLLNIGCKDNSEPNPLNIAPIVAAYLNEVLGIMEQNSINRRNIDWVQLRTDVFNQATNAQTIAAARPALSLALGRLADNHSFIVPTSGSVIFNSSLICRGERTSFTPTKEVGYIAVPFLIGTQEQAEAYARNMQRSIRNQDNPDMKGWIIDVRGYTGGNMWPMLAGVGPILGQGLAGHFVDIDDNDITWSYQNGSSFYGQSPVMSVPTPYVLLKQNPKVAVLVDNGTASSGEAIVISFIGRPNTKLFGSPSCGLSTSNQNFNLSDGSTLYLTVSTMADRNRNKFGGKIDPDEVHLGATAVEAAVRWILE